MLSPDTLPGLQGPRTFGVGAPGALVAKENRPQGGFGVPPIPSGHLARRIRMLERLLESGCTPAAGAPGIGGTPKPPLRILSGAPKPVPVRMPGSFLERWSPARRSAILSTAAEPTLLPVDPEGQAVCSDNFNYFPVRS